MVGYGSVDLTLHPELLMKVFYYNEVIATIDKFQTYVFGEILWTDTYKVCVGAGWGTEKIIMAVDMYMTFKDCYKRVIETLGELDAWFGADAKLIDLCSNSNSARIYLYDY